MKRTIIASVLLFIFFSAHSQKPKYTPKKFKSVHDESLMKTIDAPKNGFSRSYYINEPDIWDVDDNETTHVRGNTGPMVVYAEGNYVNGKREGIFRFFIIDSPSYNLYKIYEQTFINDEIDGLWKTFNLKGKVVLEDFMKRGPVLISSRF